MVYLIEICIFSGGEEVIAGMEFCGGGVWICIDTYKVILIDVSVMLVPFSWNLFLLISFSFWLPS